MHIGQLNICLQFYGPSCCAQSLILAASEKSIRGAMELLGPTLVLQCQSGDPAASATSGGDGSLVRCIVAAPQSPPPQGLSLRSRPPLRKNACLNCRFTPGRPLDRSLWRERSARFPHRGASPRVGKIARRCRTRAQALGRIGMC